MLLRYCRTMTMYDATISLPASFLVAGPRGSGKSYWVKDLLLSELLSPSPQRILYVCDSKQDDIFNPLKERYGDKIFFLDDAPTFAEMKNSLVVLDDQISEVADSKEILNAFLKGRHKNISIILLTQNLFFKSKNMKSLSNNSDFIALTASFRSRDQIKRFSQQLGWDFLYDAYLDAIKRSPFGHLLVDNRSKQKEEIRLRANIFDNLPEIICYAPKNFKTHNF